MTTLLLGATGQVGQALQRVLPAHGAWVAATRSGVLADGTPCQVADFDRPRTVVDLLQRLQPSRVINAAAYTAVDQAEQERDTAFRVNAETPALIARWCAENDVPWVHYSTDYVFDGKSRRPYLPDDPTAPLGVYGASKLAGEQAIAAAGGPCVILRTAWVHSRDGHNFLRTMLRLAAEREVLRVVSDQVGTPTSADLIAHATMRVLSRGVPRAGVWHVAASGHTSWHGFAEALLSRANEIGLLARLPQVVPIATVEFPTPAKRPAYSCLDCTSLTQDFQVELPDWRVGMEQVLADLARQSQR